jgi:hypothetical protein
LPTGELARPAVAHGGARTAVGEQAELPAGELALLLGSRRGSPLGARAAADEGAAGSRSRSRYKPAATRMRGLRPCRAPGRGGAAEPKQ